MDKSIRSETLDVFSLFNKSLYSIPPYQRSYVWKEEHVKQLWMDIKDHFDKRNKKTSHAYFLGSMVVIDNQNDSTDSDEPIFEGEVVDGQQRLTTLTTIASILFAKTTELTSLEGMEGEEFQDLQQSFRKVLGEKINGNYVARIKFDDQQLNEFAFNFFRAKPSFNEKKSYFDSIDNTSSLKLKSSPASRFMKSMEIGFDIFDCFLNEFETDTDKRNFVKDFSEHFLRNVIALKIIPDSEGMAYDLFESLNNRGFPLSQADLIKNFLLKECDTDNERDQVSDLWVSINEKIDNAPLSIKVTDLLHYSHISRWGYRKATDIYSAVVETVNESTSPVQYAKELKKDAIALTSVGKEAFNSTIKERVDALIDSLTIMNVKLAYVALVPAYQIFHKKTEWEILARMIINFCFRYMKIMSKDPASLARIMSEVAIRIRDLNSEDAKDGISDISSVFTSAAGNEVFKEEFSNASFPRQRKLAAYTLRQIENKLMEDTAIQLKQHGHKLDLEHIAPSKPTVDEWKVFYEMKSNDDNDFQRYLWRLGNMVMLEESINRSLKNKAIDLKLNSPDTIDYNHSQAISPKKVHEFLDGDEWTKKSIELRQQWLARLAPDVWRLTP